MLCLHLLWITVTSFIVMAKASAAEPEVASPASDATTQALAPYSLDVNNEFAIFNYEYFGIPYQQGKSVLGNILEARLGIHESNQLGLYLGGAGRKLFDGRGVEKAYPLLTIAWSPTSEDRLLFGSLSRRHQWTRPIYQPLVEWQRFHLDGIEYARKDLVFYLAWEQFETEEHPERFSGNMQWHRDFGIFHPSAEVRWTHQGGQEYDHPEIGVVHDRVASLGVTTKTFSGVDFAVQIEPRLFASSYSKSAKPDQNKNGRAGSLRIALRTPWPEIVYEYWNSKDFYTEDGDPLYQSQQMQTLSFTKEIVSHKDRLHFNIEAHGHWLEGKFVQEQALRVNLFLDRRWGGNG